MNPNDFADFSSCAIIKSLKFKEYFNLGWKITFGLNSEVYPIAWEKNWTIKFSKY